MDPASRFSANLRRLRADSGYSQEEVAFRAALHRTQISLMEAGSRLPRMVTLVKLAGALGVTPNDLLEGIVWQPLIYTMGGFKIS
jgi:transcriptional regulator with XRE-family HTH domain